MDTPLILTLHQALRKSKMSFLLLQRGKDQVRQAELRGPSAAQIPSIPSTNVSPPNAAQASGLAPSSTTMSGYPPSCDEDDHLTIKKLKTQHFQSSGPHAPTSPTLVQPSVPVQSAIPAQPASLLLLRPQ